MLPDNRISSYDLEFHRCPALTVDDVAVPPPPAAPVLWTAAPAAVPSLRLTDTETSVYRNEDRSRGRTRRRIGPTPAAAADECGA